MSATMFIKRYADPVHGLAARRHMEWLAWLDSGVRLPYLHPGTDVQLTFEYLPGRPAGVLDLPDLAAALGQLHASAYARELHTAVLGQPCHTTTGVTIADFHTGRSRVLEQLGITTDSLPAAIYKDANIRNFLITPSGPALVDFDDLTLAPFGYDLAKLIVSTAMTHGRLPAEHIEVALAAYNRHATAAAPTEGCTLTQLAEYAEMHHVLPPQLVNDECHRRRPAHHLPTAARPRRKTGRHARWPRRHRRTPCND